MWKGWNRSLTLFITPLAQRSSVRAWVNEQMDDCMDGLWKREDRVCLKKKVHIRWGSGMQLCSKEQLGWDKRFCPDTGNVHEVAQSSSRELKNGASAFRWDHHVSRIPPDARKFPLERKWLHSAHRSVQTRHSHTWSPADLHLSQLANTLPSLSLTVLFLYWSTISAFLFTLTSCFPVFGSGSESDTQIETLLPSFTSCVTLDKSFNIFLCLGNEG